MSNNWPQVPFLKWTHVIICSLVAILCVLLVRLAAVDILDCFEIRLKILIVAGWGILCALFGVLGAFKQDLFLYLMFYLYLLFNGFLSLRIVAGLDSFTWFYPTVCWALFLLATYFVIYLCRIRNGSPNENTIETTFSEREPNFNQTTEIL